MRISDYQDYLHALSNEGLKKEIYSLVHGSVDQIKCWVEISRRNLTIPRKTWKYEKSTEEHDHDNDLREEMHQSAVEAQRYEDSVINIFSE